MSREVISVRKAQDGSIHTSYRWFEVHKGKSGAAVREDIRNVREQELVDKVLSEFSSNMLTPVRHMIAVQYDMTVVTFPEQQGCQE